MVEVLNNRLVPGGGQSQSGSWILKTEKFTAKLSVNITPSISNDGRNINLNITLKVDDFVSVFTSLSAASSPEINNREIVTNSNLTSGDVLVLGGLTRNATAVTTTSVPILSKIPLIGNLFKQRSQTQTKSTLMVFICPKILPRRPAMDGNLEPFSQSKLDYSAKETIAQGRVFDSIKDPVTRFIFPKIGDENLKVIANFAKYNTESNPPR